MCKLLPKDFPEMNMFQQIDALIDVYEISIRLTGNISFKENIEMLKLVRSELTKQNKLVNIFDLMGSEFTKEDFIQIKST
jgi:hypothetical protein